MKFVVVLSIAVLLTGCGSGGSSSSSSSSVQSFDTSSYEANSANTSLESMTGTWVGIHSITRARSDAVNASVTPSLNSNKLEVVVIRPKGDKLEMSLCGVGFENITVTANTLDSQYRSLQVTDARTMTDSGVATKTVRLGLGSYKQTTRYSIDYIKVSDSYLPFGTLSQNWSDTEGDFVHDIYCSSIEHFEGGYRTVSLFGDSEMKFFMSDLSGPDQYDAYITDSNHVDGISNYLTLGEQNFSFSVHGPEQFLLNYSATSIYGLSVAGQASLHVPAN